MDTHSEMDHCIDTTFYNLKQANSNLIAKGKNKLQIKKPKIIREPHRPDRGRAVLVSVCVFTNPSPPKLPFHKSR